MFTLFLKKKENTSTRATTQPPNKRSSPIIKRPGPKTKTNGMIKAVQANFMDLTAVVMALAPVRAAAVKAHNATGGVIIDIMPK